MKVIDIESLKIGFSFAKEAFKVFSDGQKKSVESFWFFVLSFVSENYIGMIKFIFFMLLVAMVRAIFGNWRSLGSLLYNLFYFGTLLVIGLLFGPDIFTNIFFDLICFIIYLLSYDLVGFILKKRGFKRGRG